MLSLGCAAEEAPGAGDGGGSHRSEVVSIALDRSPVDREDTGSRTSYAPALRTAKEAVVAVHSASILRVIRQRGLDPREELMRRFFGLPPAPGHEAPQIEERRMAEGVGSGVLISPDGYILTNNHVIAGRDGAPADEILVELSGGREVSAKLVGRDPQSDLAVLKIEGEALPYLPIADSDNLEVGDIVFAVGNPMGIGLTITQGIVSATQRGNLRILGDDGYESFIQTDAPINPGNSGGALVDAYGRLIGINTAILSRSGGSMGLGFAIPSTFARQVALDLIRYGEARRGVLGVSAEDLNPEYAEAFQVPEGVGAFIQGVVEGLPADRAGLRAGDVVISVNGTMVRSARDLRLRVAEQSPGAVLELEVRREGARLKFSVTLDDPAQPMVATAPVTFELLSGVEVAFSGASGGAGEGALVVTGIAPGSPFARGIAEGMRILEINGRVPSSPEQALELLHARPVSRLYVWHQGSYGYLTVRP